jgi:hypothetical protein
MKQGIRALLLTSIIKRPLIMNYPVASHGVSDVMPDPVSSTGQALIRHPVRIDGFRLKLFINGVKLIPRQVCEGKIVNP